MKIGFSLGRCIRDIVNNDISLDEVAFIISGTAIREEAQLRQVIEDYTYRNNYLAGLDLEKCQDVAQEIFLSNRLLQPRLQGIHRHMQPENAVWVDMFPTALSNNESVKKAWDAYRFMLHMTEHVDPDSLEAFK